MLVPPVNLSFINKIKLTEMATLQRKQNHYDQMEIFFLFTVLFYTVTDAKAISLVSPF